MAEQKEEEIISKNFIEQEIEKDLEAGVYKDIMTRFPPEPNGYLHIGHAKSIILNQGLAKKYGGTFNLRFDDTNPQKEEEEFVHSILEDVKWICGGETPPVYFASDYFDKMFECAVKLIEKGKAYVCDLMPDQIREYRGTLTEPGKSLSGAYRRGKSGSVYEDEKWRVQGWRKSSSGEDRYVITKYEYA